MISERCIGVNLLNYLKQKNIEYNLEYTFISDKEDEHWKKWKGAFTFNGKIYSDYNTKKKNLKVNLLDLAYDDIKLYIKN
jgi:hypothetical protein